MSLLVVYLIDAKKRVIIPQKCVFGYDDAKVKNYGANNNQTHRVFWSADNLTDLSQVEPNFNLPLSVEYPPVNIGETCYKARVLRHFSEYFHDLFCYFYIIC